MEECHRFEKLTPLLIHGFRKDAIKAQYAANHPKCWKLGEDELIWECLLIFGIHSRYAWYGTNDYRPSEGYVPTTYFDALELVCWSFDGNDGEIYEAASVADHTMQ